MEDSRGVATTGLSGLSLVGKVLAIILGAHLVGETMIESLFPDLSRVQELLAATAVLTVLGGSVLWVLVVRPLQRMVEAERQATAAREAQLRTEGQRQDFDARLHRALEMADSESDSYTIVRRTLQRALPQHPSELLLADSSDAHLKRTVEAGPDGDGPGCGVQSPRACPAIRRGQTLVFPSSEELDACPYLQDRPYGPSSAACVPVNVAGRSIGVLHAVGPLHQPPGPEPVVRLEALAGQGGARIGMLRVMQRTSLQAATDPLTGLLNRRTLETQAHELLRRGEPFALAIGDLDHFKRLNDTHGHETGDRALRSFARTLRASVRAEDLICRFGGEEFVLVFPRRTARQASDVLRRTQEELVVTTTRSNVPGFTVSYGVTDSSQAGTLEELLRIADMHLFRAKHEGRNRIVDDQADTAGTPAAATPA
jgi:diguanylate cyclase (GGDEF)-like protein